MIKINEYFNGNVKSMAIITHEGKATVGVMLPGNYEFGTSSEEKMEIIEGEMLVSIPGQEKKTYCKGQYFIVPANIKFNVEILRDTAYICYYK
ncbi:MAG: pyrimidine/purine nucleoside phosphorylase [Bacteroidales bacterium]|nr:pyrimidine/purine nucleoside phosphorylase [Bacteroidales bacterium]